MSERWGDSARDRADLDRYITREPNEEECPECGSPMTWMQYLNPIPKYGGGMSEGRWVCSYYGGCEYAPG